jgi:hypothetical protein
MPVTSSRLGPGVLSLGTEPVVFSCQVTNCRLVPSANEEDALPTLCEPDRPASVTFDWSLAGTVIQDWELSDTEGFVEYCRAHAGQEVPFEFVPNSTLTVKYTGTCQIRPVEIGGDVAAQTTTDFEFPLNGDPVRGVYSPVVEP